MVDFQVFSTIFNLIVSIPETPAAGKPSYNGTPALAKGLSKLRVVVNRLGLIPHKNTELEFSRKVLTFIGEYYDEYECSPSLSVVIDYINKNTAVHEPYIKSGARFTINEDAHLKPLMDYYWQGPGLYVPGDIEVLLDNYLGAITRSHVANTFTEFLESTVQGLLPGDVERLTESIQTVKPSVDSPTWDHTELSEDAYRKFHEAWMRRKLPLYTGLPSIDVVTRGFGSGDMVSIVGGTGHGKSALVTQWAYNALKNGLNGLYITLEMEVGTVQARFYSLHSGDPKFFTIHGPVPAPDITKGEFCDAGSLSFVFNTVIPDFNKLPGKLRVLRPLGAFTTVELERMMNENDSDPNNPIHYVIIDHPGWIDPPSKKNQSAFQNTDDIYRQIRRICLDHKGTGIICMMPVQASQKGYDAAAKNDGIYSITGIATSAEIARSSTHLFFISSFESMREEGLGIVGCLKDRDGGRHKCFRIRVNPFSGSVTEDVEPPPSGPLGVDPFRFNL